jgi:hypothetical protein
VRNRRPRVGSCGVSKRWQWERLLAKHRIMLQLPKDVSMCIEDPVDRKLTFPLGSRPSLT